MKSDEVKKLNDAELTEEAGRLRSELFKLRSQAVTEKLENPRQLGNLKRDVARVLTEQNSRKARATQESTK